MRLALAAAGAAWLVIVAGPASAQGSAAATFTGTWASNPFQCWIDQSVDAAPLVIRADRLDQHETHCTFSSVRKLGPATWKIRARCQVEGSRTRQTFTISVAGGDLTITDKAGSRTLLRCP